MSPHECGKIGVLASVEDSNVCLPSSLCKVVIHYYTDERIKCSFVNQTGRQRCIIIYDSKGTNTNVHMIMMIFNFV